jgi:hypothetical protein
MAKSKVKIFDCESGEEIVREATAEEIAQMELDAASYVAYKAKLEADAIQKQAILDRIGLTADEIKLLLG